MSRSAPSLDLQHLNIRFHKTPLQIGVRAVPCDLHSPKKTLISVQLEPHVRYLCNYCNTRDWPVAHDQINGSPF